METSLRYVFLLGGMDLEMSEIKNLLLRQKLELIDNDLTWGAMLSSYAIHFDSVRTFVGIELIKDIDPPAHYIEIDHHNANSYKESSIEQVARLLDIELTRYQQIVAANDRGYIPALLQLGATTDEIESIRRADREAQGATLEDEALAVRSIESNLVEAGGLMIVESLTPKFSCITDRLFPFNKLLISFKNHFIYYGEGAQQLIDTYGQLIKDNKAYYGGINNDFFGLDKNSFTTEEANRLKREVIQRLSEK